MSSEEKKCKPPGEDYQRLIESLNEGVYWIDAQGMIGYLSPTIETYSGYPAEHLIGTPVLGLISNLLPGDERLLAAAHAAIWQGVPTQIEVRQRLGSGEVRYLRISGRAIYEGGKLVGEAGTITDVTESFCVPTDLGPTTEMLSKVFANSMDGIWLLDENTVCLAWNEAMVRITGLTRRQALGKTGTEINTLLERQEWQGVAPIQSEGQPIVQGVLGDASSLSAHRLLSIRSLDGQRRVIDSVAFDVPSTRGMLRAGINRDVTRNVELHEARLQELQRRDLLASAANRLATEAVEELPNLIPEILGQAASNLGVERLVVNYFTCSGLQGQHQFGWFAPGFELDMARLDAHAFDEFHWSQGFLLRGEPLCVTSRQDWPDPAASERKFAEDLGIQALLVVPLALEGRGAGALLAMDSKDRRVWGADLVQMLTTLGEILVAAIDRYQAMKDLRQSEQNYQAIAVLTSDFAVSLEKDASGLVHEVWHVGSFEELFGGPFDPQRPYSSWFHADDHARLSEHRRRLLAGKADVAEFRILPVAGGVRWLRSYGYTRPVVETGSGAPVYVAMQDITREKQAEENLQKLQFDLERANTELKRALRSRDSFLATVSGELRSPLFAIQSNCDLMEEGLFGELTLRQVRSLKSIRENSNHLMALVNDILDITLLDAGELKLNLNPVDVKEVIFSSMRLVRTQAHQKNLLLTFHIDERLGKIEADEGRLKQIMANLMTNAVKFTPENGLINIEADLDEELELVRFSVSDTGTGIEAQDLRTLFHPFTRVYGVEKRNAGAGLGLVLVRCLAELHGGGVQVESQAGKGSTFVVTIPWRKPPQQKTLWQVVDPQYANKGGSAPNGSRLQAAVSISPSAGAAVEPAGSIWVGPDLTPAKAEKLPTILLVDDMELSILPLREYLEAFGYQVHIARDGEEAVREARRLRPQVILMDIQLPVMDGLEATRRIRKEPGLEGVYIIALSALAMPGDRERFMEAGFDVYLSKPVPLKRVHQAVLGVPQPADVS